MSGETGMVKKETVIIAALAALIIGFLGGIVFSVYKSPTSQQTAGMAPQQGGQQQSGLSPEVASQIMALEQAAASSPNSADAWSQLGHIYFDTGQPQKAISAYEKSLAIQPNNANVLTDLGVMYRQVRDPVKAVESFDKAMAADPKHEISRLNKGIVLFDDLKDEEGAFQAWESLAELNPNAGAPGGVTITEFLKTMRQQAGK